MKRLTWIVLIFGMLFVTACANQPPAAPLAAAPTSAPVTAEPVVVIAEPLPTETLVEVVPVTGVTPEPVKTEETFTSAVVSADGLNLRVGPGLNYRILGILMQGESLQLSGRSQDGEWINVRTSTGVDGWVFGAYLSTKASFAALPVLEAFGGPAAALPEPEVETSVPSKYTFNVSISYNIASVSLTGLPAKKDVYLRLGVRGGGQSMIVASGSTGANGAALFTFEMPTYWPDGSAVTQSQLFTAVETVDGSFSRSVNITYYTGE